MRLRTAACALAVLVVDCAWAQTPVAPAPDAAPAPQTAVPGEEKSPPITQGGGFGVKTSLRFVGAVQPPHNRTVCMLPGLPPEEMRYERIAVIKANKGTYGKVDEVLQEMAEQARHFGADAIVALNSRQHVNVFLPWRYSRPIGEGMLVYFHSESPKLDCEKAGGRVF